MWSIVNPEASTPPFIKIRDLFYFNYDSEQVHLIADFFFQTSSGFYLSQAKKMQKRTDIFLNVLDKNMKLNHREADLQ